MPEFLIKQSIPDDCHTGEEKSPPLPPKKILFKNIKTSKNKQKNAILHLIICGNIIRG